MNRFVFVIIFDNVVILLELKRLSITSRKKTLSGISSYTACSGILAGRYGESYFSVSIENDLVRVSFRDIDEALGDRERICARCTDLQQVEERFHPDRRHGADRPAAEDRRKVETDSRPEIPVPLRSILVLIAVGCGRLCRLDTTRWIEGRLRRAQ